MKASHTYRFFVTLLCFVLGVLVGGHPNMALGLGHWLLHHEMLLAIIIVISIICAMHAFWWERFGPY